MRDVAQATTNSAVFIERMTEHDLLEVVEIEQESRLSYWGWDAYHTELQSPFDSIMLVARKNGVAGAGDPSVIAFIVGRCFAGEVHINNMAVRFDFRRRGIGQELLSSVLSWGKSKEASLAVLEVRAGNAAAQALYRASGFEVVGRRRRYYKDPVEDALIMTVSFERQALI